MGVLEAQSIVLMPFQTTVMSGIEGKRGSSNGPPENRSKREHGKLETFGPYDPEFAPALKHHGVKFPGSNSPGPSNIQELRQVLEQDPPSLEDGSAMEALRQKFLVGNEEASNEADTKMLMPLLLGESSIFCIREKLTHMLHRIGEEFKQAKPDLFDGERPESFDERLKRQLDGFLEPGAGAPCLPNFFLEVKGPNAPNRVAVNQAVLDGVVGARGIQELRCHLYGEANVKDDRAFTIVVIYESFNAVVKIFCAWVPGDTAFKYECHLVKAYYLEYQFAAAVKAIRSIRQWASMQRKEFVNAARSRN